MQEDWTLKGPVPRQQTPAKENRKRRIWKNLGNDSRFAQRRTKGDDGRDGEKSVGHGFCLRRTASTSVSASLDIYSVDSLQDKHSLNIIISVKHN